MARDKINVVLPTIDNSQSAGISAVAKKAVVVANGICIEKALASKNNTLFILIENTGSAVSKAIIKAGDNYPNKKLGDLEVAMAVGLNAIQLQDSSRFENRDGSVNIDFATGFTGNIFAVAKRAGLLPVTN